MHSEIVARAQPAFLKLAAIHSGDSPAMLFEALAEVMPVAGGMLGSMGSIQPTDTHSHAVLLPDTVLQAWATTPGEKLQVMMSPLLPAAPGTLISDRDALDGAFREQLELLNVLDGAGLGETAGYKVAEEHRRVGHTMTRFLTLALERGQRFTPEHHALLRALHPQLAAALGLMELPLLPHQALATQILEQQHCGYMCLDRNGTPVESNRRAHCLADDYATALGRTRSRKPLLDFASWLANTIRGGGPWKLWRADHQARLTIQAHHLRKEHYAIGRDLVLVTLTEDRLVDRIRAVAPTLGGRRLEAACHLAFGGLSNREIADAMNIAKKTVDNHLDAVYAAAGVSNAREFQAKLI